jgi:hypothetical protein
MIEENKSISAKLISPASILPGSKSGFFWLDLNLNFETNEKIIKFTPSEILQCKFSLADTSNNLRARLRVNANFDNTDIEFELAVNDLTKFKKMLENYGVLVFDESNLNSGEKNLIKQVQVSSAIKPTQAALVNEISEASVNKTDKYSDIRNPNTKCSNCGSKPAGPIRLNSTAGRIIWSTTRKLDTNLCAACAELAYIQQQKINLTQGWWAPRSAFLTVIYLIKNIFNIATHRKEINKIPINGAQIPRPKLNIRGDGKTVIIGVISAVVLLFFINAYTNSGTTESKLGSCWHIYSGDQMEKVECSSESADYKVSSIVDDVNKCPYEWYLEISLTEFGCLSSY